MLEEGSKGEMGCDKMNETENFLFCSEEFALCVCVLLHELVVLFSSFLLNCDANFPLIEL
jgi:hypothetical protein